MKKRAYLAAAAICAAGIGIAGAYLTACGNDARQTSGSIENSTEISGDGISENSISGNTVSENSSLEETSVPENGGSAENAQEEAAEKGLLPEEERVKVKGIYVTGAMAGTSGMDDLIALVDRTELNAMVIDVKNDDGRVVYEMDTPLVSEVGSAQRLVSDMPELIRTCREHGIYLIARIVAFKDPFLAENRTDLALHNTDGSLFRDSSGLAWVNPYQEEVWEYLLEIAKEAARIGFDEIQFDYIRFPTDGENLGDAFYRWQDEGMDKESALMSFLSYARQEIKAPISIDVYGANGWHRSGSRTGQEVEVLSDYVDVICPMYYPNHFSQNFMAYKPEIQRPYRIYYFGSYRNAVICRNKVVIRPYAQAFYLPVSYDKKYYDEDYVQRQIFGIRDSINQGYTYWNNSGRYEDLRKDPLDTDEYPWDNKPEERSTQKINLFNCKVDLTAD